jgi:hypothetical protein
MLDHTVPAGIDKSFVTVIESDQIRRLTLRISHLKDFTVPIRRFDRLTADENSIAYCRMHIHRLP